MVLQTWVQLCHNKYIIRPVPSALEVVFARCGLGQQRISGPANKTTVEIQKLDTEHKFSSTAIHIIVG